VTGPTTYPVQVPAGSTFSGVLQGPGGVPLSGWTLYLDGVFSVQTGSDGSFSLTVVSAHHSLQIGSAPDESSERTVIFIHTPDAGPGLDLSQSLVGQVVV